MNAVLRREIPYPTEQGDYTLRYYLLTDPQGVCGIRVIRSGGQDPASERADVFPLSLDREQVLRMLALLADGSVPPCTLSEIVSDLIGADAPDRL